MRTFVFAAVLAFAVAVPIGWQAMLTSHAGDGPNPPLAEGRSSFDETRPRLAPGQIVVRFRGGASEGAIGRLNAAHGARTLKVQPVSGLRRLALPAAANVDTVLAAYRNSPLVEEAGPSHIVRAFEAPNDTNYSYQWHLHDTVGGMWAESAWGLSTNKGQGVVVAVIDTGVAYEDHSGVVGGFFPQDFKQAPDLAATTFVAPWDFFNNDAHANDDNGHGSHVTGTITQDTGNAYGVAGIAYNSTIMPVKVLDYSGFGNDDDLVEAIYYAVNNGAQVISMSLGFTGTGAPDAAGEVCTEIVGLNDALNFAYESGVVVVAAAGNESTSTVTCPAAYPTVIAVGATRFDGQVAPYSNGGDRLDLTAPGGDPNVDQNGDGFSDGAVQETYCYDWLTLFLIGTYDFFCNVFLSGTSMATPHVAGTVALLLGEDPTLTPDEARFYVESTARDRGPAGWDASYGWGVLDAHAAVAALNGASPTATPNTPPTATATPAATPEAPATATATPTPAATGTATATPAATATPTATPEATATATATPTSSATVSVDDIRYATAGGRSNDRHLLITVALVDGTGQPVGGASVSIDLLRNDILYAFGTGSTGAAGTVTFRASNAPSGCYRTEVPNVTAEGLSWDGVTPENGFSKGGAVCDQTPTPTDTPTPTETPGGPTAMPTNTPDATATPTPCPRGWINNGRCPS